MRYTVLPCVLVATAAASFLCGVAHAAAIPAGATCPSRIIGAGANTIPRPPPGRAGAGGAAILVNSCAAPIYANVVTGVCSGCDRSSTRPSSSGNQRIDPGARLWQPFADTPDVGVSIKFGLVDDPTGTSPISQLEYNVHSEGHVTWYDLSNIDGHTTPPADDGGGNGDDGRVIRLPGAEGYPFDDFGMHLSVHRTAAERPSGACVDLTCPPGERRCRAVYNEPEDEATRMCWGEVDLVVEVCRPGF